MLLRRSGWTVLRYWEHDIEQRLPRVLRRIRGVLAAIASKGLLS